MVLAMTLSVTEPPMASLLAPAPATATLVTWSAMLMGIGMSVPATSMLAGLGSVGGGPKLALTVTAPTAVTVESSMYAVTVSVEGGFASGTLGLVGSKPPPT